MVARFIRPLSLCACMVTLATDVAAQATVATGELRGTVVDRTGASLTGVTVEISGDHLMGGRSTASETDGSFRFPGLPAGRYSVVFTRAGFTTLRRDQVHVAIGFTATVDVRLDVASVEDYVVVERDASVIDRRSTAIATAFTARTLATSRRVRPESVASGSTCRFGRAACRIASSPRAAWAR